MQRWRNHRHGLVLMHFILLAATHVRLVKQSQSFLSMIEKVLFVDSPAKFKSQVQERKVFQGVSSSPRLINETVIP